MPKKRVGTYVNNMVIGGEKTTCGICGFMGSSTAMRLHAKIKHEIDIANNNRPRCCEYCRESFDSSKKLLAHAKERHKSEFVRQLRLGLGDS